jgi:hypothetical protein
MYIDTSFMIEIITIELCKECGELRIRAGTMSYEGRDVSCDLRSCRCRRGWHSQVIIVTDDPDSAEDLNYLVKAAFGAIATQSKWEYQEDNKTPPDHFYELYVIELPSKGAL